MYIGITFLLTTIACIFLAPKASA